MITRMWNWYRDSYELVMVKIQNRYQGLILFIMLLAIWYKQIILVLRVLQEALIINCLTKEVI